MTATTAKDLRFVTETCSLALEDPRLAPFLSRIACMIRILAAHSLIRALANSCLHILPSLFHSLSF